MTDGHAGSEPTDAQRRERFESLFARTYSDLMAYAVRRCSVREDAEDLVADTYAVAWRRLDEVPAGHEARLWLFGTARLVRLAQFRGARRRRRLLARLASVLGSDRHEWPLADGDPEVRAAFNELGPPDREVLALSLWEGLSAQEIATVLEVTEAAVWKRLERARTRLRNGLQSATKGDVTRTSAVPSARSQRSRS